VPEREQPEKEQAMIDDQLEQMRSQLAYEHEHAHNPQQTEHGQELAGDAPGGLTWAEFILKQRPAPAGGDSELERLRSLPDEQQQERQEQDRSRGRGPAGPPRKEPTP
jgi:hypothetical protein